MSQASDSAVDLARQGFYDVFDLPDPNNTEVQWDRFQRLVFLTLKYVISHIHKAHINTDNYILENCSGVVSTSATLWTLTFFPRYSTF